MSRVVGSEVTQGQVTGSSRGTLENRLGIGPEQELVLGIGESNHGGGGAGERKEVVMGPELESPS